MMNEEDGSMSVNNSLINFLKILFSYNSNVLLAALVFLLLVVIFVLLLHFYARFYLSPSHQDLSAAAQRRRRRRRNRRRTVTTPRIIPSFSLGGFDGGLLSSPAAAVTIEDKGLDLSVISSIPLFVYEDDGDEEGECVICLGLWEAGDFGRRLRNCGHGFHLECIDMWFSSHSTCPLCRSPVLSASSDEDKLKQAVNCVQEEEEEDEEAEVTDGVGEGDVRIDVLDEEINGGESRSDRRSMSMTSSATSSLMRMLSCSSSSTRSERNKVFPSTTQDSS